MSSESLDLLLQNKATLCVLALLEILKTIQASFFSWQDSVARLKTTHTTKP